MRKNDGTINRADAIEQIQTWAVNLINPKMLSREDAIYILESMPTAQPKIIRCKDCKYWAKTEGDERWSIGDCSFWEKSLVMCEGYCAWAERKDDD